ncbi:acyl-CoA oxidase [Allocatelliglobosispora scoriae]|uniref:Acyl-CoA oxidase n=1 Tax=Allocatelliglobosispora scoriae TaxID=643052 RepID=A0A841BCU2_9ACTN|nr:acyl-CoA dehydrogenase [Allocatelliglobosispora scoriae]MBB5866927.1 acyl-CoA oxidase [Allocatelliglobosispora scoriae]
MPLPATPPAGSAALAELEDLLHGPCDPGFLSALSRALTSDQMPARPDLADRGDRLPRRMQSLARELPPVRELLADPALMATVLAWVTIAEPALSMTVIGQNLLCLGSMMRLSPDHEALKAQFDALESGQVRGCYLVTEVGQSNSHLATRTQAEFDPQTREFVLQTPDPVATKFTNVAAGGGPASGVVVARLVVGGVDCGVFSFLVDLTDDNGPLPGIRISTGLEVSTLPLDYAQVRFDRYRVPYARWLRDSAQITDEGAFEDPLGSADLRLQRTLCIGQGLWGALPAAAAAVCRQSAVLSLRYARQRRTQGRLAPGTPLLDYRTQQHAVLGGLAEAFALTCSADRARVLWEESLSTTDGAAGGGSPMTFSPWTAVSRPLSAYKALAVRTAARVTADCQRHCGFPGHLDVNRLSAYHGFFQSFDAAGGDSQLILYDLGRTRTDDADDESAGTPYPSNPAEPTWWPAVIRVHEQRLAERLRGLRDGGAETGTSAFQAWNPLLGRAGELGETCAMRLAADDVARTLAAVRDPHLRTVLDRLASLHGVMTARRWAGSLLTAETLRASDLAGLSQIADALCDELLPHLPLLEEAFSYPAEVAGVPLAAADYNQALVDTLEWHHGEAA